MKVQEARNKDNIEILEKGGHHEPNSQRYHDKCGCTPETDGGNAYRDLVTGFTNENNELITKRYYHQSRVITVVNKHSGGVRKVDVNTHGYGGSSITREIINEDMPDGFRLVQRDHIPMLRLPSGDVVDVPQRFTIRFDELEEGWIRVANWDGSKPVVDVNNG